VINDNLVQFGRKDYQHVLCLCLYGQLLVPLAFLSYGTLLVRLFFMLFLCNLCSVK